MLYEVITFGARPIRRIISSEIENLLSQQILEGSVVKGDDLKLVVKDNMFYIEKPSLIQAKRNNFV